MDHGSTDRPIQHHRAAHPGQPGNEGPRTDELAVPPRGTSDLTDRTNLNPRAVDRLVRAFRAMVVDDNAIDRAYVRAMLHYLTEGKVEIDEAESAKVAAALFEPGRYELVVSDYHLMGAENGVDVLNRIKSIDPNCRRVLITGDSRKDVAKQARHGEVAESVILKTSGPALIREALSPLLPT